MKSGINDPHVLVLLAKRCFGMLRQENYFKTTMGVLVGQTLELHLNTSPI